MNSLDRVSILCALEDAFSIAPDDKPISHIVREDLAKAAGATTIGAEIEVRFSSYFPQLFHKYQLHDRQFAQLSAADQEQFSREAAVEELALLPKLNTATSLGVPKGKDRYWEFAHRPSYHPYTLAREINILKQANLIPDNQSHSLQITLGGLPPSKDAHILLMALEILGFTSPGRMNVGINPDKAAGWARRGRGGIRSRKDGIELGHTCAIELRTLELPREPNKVRDLLYIAWFLAETIRRPDLQHSWEAISKETIALATEYELPTDINWGRGFENIDTWTLYANSLMLMNNAKLWLLVRQAINNQDKSSSVNLYLRNGISWD